MSAIDNAFPNAVAMQLGEQNQKMVAPQPTY
jgi:hypothetical protein